MANPEHLEILKQGFEVWNGWRNKHPKIMPDFDSANLRNADLHNANLSYANLYNTNLRNANLLNVNLKDANLSYAYLRDANMSNANLNRANFNYGHILNASLAYTKLTGTNFNNARLGYTNFANTDLSETIGLETVQHSGPSEIGISTIYLSQGKIPEVFLRGCGLPESFIVQIPALVASLEPIRFYKCFISFTEADDAFSERLYNDLQMKGVRCWRWKEDAKWGKTLMRSIDEAVHYYDKLIVICSEQSLNSPAVIREIERALQKEDELARSGKDAEVLFPIRLDDYIFAWNHHRKADVIAKNVGDFRTWNEPETYKKAFERLLRDLKASE